MEVIHEVEKRVRVVRGQRLACERFHRLTIRTGPIHRRRANARNQAAIAADENRVLEAHVLKPAGQLRVIRALPPPVHHRFHAKQFQSGSFRNAQVPPLTLKWHQSVFAVAVRATAEIDRLRHVRRELRFQFRESFRCLLRELFERFIRCEHSDRQSARERRGPLRVEVLWVDVNPVEPVHRPGEHRFAAVAKFLRRVLEVFLVIAVPRAPTAAAASLRILRRRATSRGPSP